MARSKIIVTGGTGYVGSHTVVDLVQNGFEPIVLDDFSNSERSVVERLAAICACEIRCHEVDCRDRPAVAQIFRDEGPIAGVIHFAAAKSVGESPGEAAALLREQSGFAHHDSGRDGRGGRA